MQSSIEQVVRLVKLHQHSSAHRLWYIQWFLHKEELWRLPWVMFLMQSTQSEEYLLLPIFINRTCTAWWGGYWGWAGQLCHAHTPQGNLSGANNRLVSLTRVCVCVGVGGEGGQVCVCITKLIVGRLQQSLTVISSLAFIHLWRILTCR